MQTFIPYTQHRLSARSLDRQRLGKQRVECKQILLALAGESRGWVNHPAVKMWAGHERFLASYALNVCAEWRSRGYVDNLRQEIQDLSVSRFTLETSAPPRWWGGKRVHVSHMASLLRKDRDHYLAAFNLSEREATKLVNTYPDYVWPV